MVTTALPTTFVPAPLVAEQFRVADVPAPTEKATLALEAPAVIVPPESVHETLVPLTAGTLAASPTAFAVA